MASPKRIRLMISSRCNDKIPYLGKVETLTKVRLDLKKELEVIQLLGSQLMEVWINEDAPASDGSQDSWDVCMDQVRRADLVIAIYNGNSGWPGPSGSIGICHAEIQAALSVAPAKFRFVEVDPLIQPGAEKDKQFQSYIASLNMFRGASAKTGEEVIERIKQALREGIVELAHLGGKEARKGNNHTGAALDWNRLDYGHRKEAITHAISAALLARPGSTPSDAGPKVQIGKSTILMLPHAVPAAMGISSAREMVGQPFLRDQALEKQLVKPLCGPVHVIGVHKSISEGQAIKMLGFPDAVIVKPPFGLYVADSIQKIQLVFIANCADETSTRQGVQRFFDWLEQTGEDKLLAQRAEARTRIVRAIAKEQTQTS